MTSSTSKQRKADVGILGRARNPTASRLARMNRGIRNIEGNLGREFADRCNRNLHKDFKAEHILASLPFNLGDRLREAARWKFGMPSAGNANYGWVQDFIPHLPPTTWLIRPRQREHVFQPIRRRRLPELQIKTSDAG